MYVDFIINKATKNKIEYKHKHKYNTNMNKIF